MANYMVWFLVWLGQSHKKIYLRMDQDIELLDNYKLFNVCPFKTEGS